MIQLKHFLGLDLLKFLVLLNFKYQFGVYILYEETLLLSEDGPHLIVDLSKLEEDKTLQQILFIARLMDPDVSRGLLEEDF